VLVFVGAGVIEVVFVVTEVVFIGVVGAEVVVVVVV